MKSWYDRVDPLERCRLRLALDIFQHRGQIVDGNGASILYPLVWFKSTLITWQLCGAVEPRAWQLCGAVEPRAGWSWAGHLCHLQFN